MNEHEDFDRTLRGWIVDEGRGSAPAHLASDIATGIAGRTPRPTWLALVLGDGMGRPIASVGSARRPLALLVVAGLLLAIIAGAVMVAGSARRELSVVTVPSPAPAVIESPAPSASSATSAAADGLILFAERGVERSPDGSSTDCSTYHTIRPDGSGERDLAGGCVALSNASWSPAGDGIIIDSTPLSSSTTPSNTTKIYEIAADGGAQHALLTLAGGYEPTFSPDGSQIAYARDSGGINIAAADGTRPRRLTSTLDPTKSVDTEPRFSPDGSRLVFTRWTIDPAGLVPGAAEVWMVKADGTDLHRLTAGPSQSSSARWSPDGSHLLFTVAPPVTGSASTDMGLSTIDADGTGLTRVPNTGGGDDNADWSPDGSRIVYTHFDANAVTSLRVMNADGSGMTTLLSSSPGQPDGFNSLHWRLPRPETP